jgi:hypothetical protein
LLMHGGTLVAKKQHCTGRGSSSSLTRPAEEEGHDSRHTGPELGTPSSHTNV